MKRQFAAKLKRENYNPKKDITIGILVGIIIVGCISAMTLYFKDYGFSQKEWAPPKQSEWIYEEAHYKNVETGDKLSVEDFESCIGTDLDLSTAVLSKPFEPSTYFLGYKKYNDGYQIPGSPETFVSEEVYAEYKREYEDMLSQYEADMISYEKSVEVMQSKLGGVYEFVDESYVLKSDSARRTPVDVYNQYYASE